MTALFDLRHGDCLDPISGLASLGDKSVTHVITDPPYSAQTHAGARTGDGDEVLVDSFDCIDAVGLALAFAEIGRVVQRWVVSTVDWKHAALLERDVPPRLRFVRCGVWVKPNGAPQFTGDRPAHGWEAVAILHRDAPGRMRWNGGGRPAVWTFNKTAGEHPTQKPVELIERFIRDFTDPGDLICDPFTGSGTTGVAAIRHGRRFIGWERNAGYAAIATKRIGAAREQLGLFNNTEGAA